MVELILSHRVDLKNIYNIKGERMFKQKTILEVKGADDRIYRLECDSSSPLGELYDAVFTMKNIVMKQLEDHISKEQPKKEEEKECPEQT